MRNCRFRHVNRDEFEAEVYSCLLREMENVFGIPMRPPPPPHMSIPPPKARFSEFMDPYETDGFYDEGYPDEPEVMYLRREVTRYRAMLESGGGSGANVEELKSSNSKFMSQNAELQDKVRFLTRENGRLMDEMQAGWPSQGSADLQRRCKELEMQNDQLNERYSTIKTDYFTLENKKQAMDQNQIFIKDQVINVSSYSILLYNSGSRGNIRCP